MDILLLYANHEVLSMYFAIQVPAGWTEFGAPIFEYTLERLKSNPEDAEWWSWLPVLRETNELVGSCGFKGKPNAAGEVEIGYEIAAAHRQKGLGTEAALALRDLAFRSAEVKKAGCGHKRVGCAIVSLAQPHLSTASRRVMPYTTPLSAALWTRCWRLVQTVGFIRWRCHCCRVAGAMASQSPA